MSLGWALIPWDSYKKGKLGHIWIVGTRAKFSCRVWRYKRRKYGDSLEVQQLRFCAFTSGGTDSVPGWEVGELRSHMSHSTAKKKKKKGNNNKRRKYGQTQKSVSFYKDRSMHRRFFFGNIHFWSFWASLMASGTQHGGKTLLPLTMLQETGCSHEQWWITWNDSFM